VTEPTFFPTPDDFRAWLAEHHETADELIVGFYKKATGKPSITWPEAVDEALCFGWIDGIRRTLDEEAYTNRFTPRRKRSNWSKRNIDRVTELTALGRMHPAGLLAFEIRTEANSGGYSFERREGAALDEAEAAEFRARAGAWAFFEAQAPWYRRAALHWVVSAKRAETRGKRLATLIEDSASGRTIAPLTRRAGADSLS
jgi:uncharacterized protein YdeI (YjbR/CyaY-like superfamily)